MNSGVTYWAGIGTLYLVLMIWQDYTNNRYIDERYNYLMFGVTIGLIAWFNVTIWYLLILTGIVFGLSILIFQTKALGGGDAQALGWIFYGYGLIDVNIFAAFAIFFMLSSVLYLGAKQYIFRYDRPVPFFGVIFINYVLVNLLFGLY